MFNKRFAIGKRLLVFITIFSGALSVSKLAFSSDSSPTDKRFCALECAKLRPSLEDLKILLERMNENLLGVDWIKDSLRFFSDYMDDIDACVFIDNFVNYPTGITKLYTIPSDLRPALIEVFKFLSSCIQALAKDRNSWLALPGPESMKVSAEHAFLQLLKYLKYINYSPERLKNNYTTCISVKPKINFFHLIVSGLYRGF